MKHRVALIKIYEIDLDDNLSDEQYELDLERAVDELEEEIVSGHAPPAVETDWDLDWDLPRLRR